jgi:hypothetical protein
VEIEVCASPSNKVDNDIQERECVRPKMKLSNRLPDIGNGKLAGGASSQREETEEGRVAG